MAVIRVKIAIFSPISSAKVKKAQTGADVTMMIFYDFRQF
jgi:hypothetical protein